MDEDLKGGGSGLLQSTYFFTRLRALRKTSCTAARMQEGLLYIPGIITKSFMGLRRPNLSRMNHQQYYRLLPIHQLSQSSVIGMYHTVCSTALESGSGRYSFAIMNSPMHGTEVRQSSCWFYIVTFPVRRLMDGSVSLHYRELHPP
jgi:hypothetical protein